MIKSLISSITKTDDTKTSDQPKIEPESVVKQAEFPTGIARVTTMSLEKSIEQVDRSPVNDAPTIESYPANMPLPLTQFTGESNGVQTNQTASPAANPSVNQPGNQPINLPADQAITQPMLTTAMPERTTAPTVFITSTTATSEPSPLPLITVGPVIGLVTESTARVMIECNQSLTVGLTCTLVETNVRAKRAGLQAGSVGDRSLINVDATTEGFLVQAIAEGAVRDTKGLNLPNINQSTNRPSDTSVHGTFSIATEPSPQEKEYTAYDSTNTDNSKTLDGKVDAQLAKRPEKAQQINQSVGSPGLEAINQANGNLPVNHSNGNNLSVNQSINQPVPTNGTIRLDGRPVAAAADVLRVTNAQRASTCAYVANHTFNQSSKQSTSQNAKSQSVIEKQIQVEAHRMTAVTLTGLQPDSKYELTFAGVGTRVPSSFVTLIDGWKVDQATPFNWAFVSCNLFSVTKDLADPSSDLWLNLRDRVAAGQVDYVCHIGDQIYADEKRSLDDTALDERYQLVFKTGVEMLKGVKEEEWPVCAQHIKELYRQLYRETWSHPPTAFVLANVPSLTIYDDHDFRDDWGNEPCDSDPSTPEYFVGRCAHAIMCEYQRQLWSNVDFGNLNEIKRDYHMHAFGEHGVIFLDVRGPRSLHMIEHDPYPYIGSLQWQELKRALSDEGIMRGVRHLIINCPAPIVFLPTSLNDLLGQTVIDDALGHWSSKPFKAEQIMMLDLCRQWKMANPARELTFVGGDVHVGGHSEITLNGEVVFQQMITSAISNYRLSQFEFFVGNLTKEYVNELSDGWGFKHRGFTRERNYGLLTVSLDEHGVYVNRQHVTPESKGEDVPCDNRRGIDHLS